MKICVIGNSHVAAIKLAYEAMPTPPHDITFFAGLGRRIATFESVDGKLRPRADDHKIRYAIGVTSGGLTEIDPAAYDAFLLMGMSGWVHQLVETLRRPISEGAKACAITDYWQTAPLHALLTNLRKTTQKPISVGLVPLLAEERRNDAGPESYAQFISLSNTLYFNAFNACLVGQPLETIVNGDATEISYSRMSERLIEGTGEFDLHHPEGENSHMNQSYGALWLAQYFQQVSS